MGRVVELKEEEEQIILVFGVSDFPCPRFVGRLDQFVDSSERKGSDYVQVWNPICNFGSCGGCRFGCRSKRLEQPGWWFMEFAIQLVADGCAESEY